MSIKNIPSPIKTGNVSPPIREKHRKSDKVKRGGGRSNKIIHPQKQVDEVITRILQQLPRQLHKSIHYLFKGKRIRSSLMFSLAEKLQCRLAKIVLPAVGVEIIHTISLIHDDVIDRQMIRRGQHTLHGLYGNRAAIFIGDFLLHCLAMEMTGYRYSREVIDALYRKIAELCRGEVLQDIPTGIISPGRREYLQMIRQKTGSLFSYSFMVPVLLSEKPSSIRVGFAEECGYLFGLGFQLADDIADLEEDMEVIRNEKIIRRDGDSPERLFSYPILLWQETDTEGFQEYFHKPSVDQIKKVRDRLRELIYTEITEKLHQLEIRSHQGKEDFRLLFLFLQEEIDKLFVKNEMN